MKNTCRFCDILKGKDFYGKIDCPLFETENFFSVSTIGALVEGWVLVIPKKHDYSMRLHYQSEELLQLVNNIKLKLHEKYGKPIILFEHGANECNSLTSCGTNHAHLHLVPFDGSLLLDMQKDMRWESCNIHNINEVVSDKEYLYYCELPLSKEAVNGVEGVVSTLSEPISQYFRKLIATKLGIPERYNYKEYPHIEIALKTFDSLSQAV